MPGAVCAVAPVGAGFAVVALEERVVFVVEPDPDPDVDVEVVLEPRPDSGGGRSVPLGTKIVVVVVDEVEVVVLGPATRAESVELSRTRATPVEAMSSATIDTASTRTEGGGQVSGVTRPTIPVALLSTPDPRRVPGRRSWSNR